MPLLLIAVLLVAVSLTHAQDAPPALQIDTETLRYAADPTGQTILFEEKATVTNHAAPCPLASLRRDGKDFPVTALSATPAKLKPGQTARLDLTFGESGVTAVVRLSAYPRHLTFEVSSVSDEAIEELTFCDLRTTLKPEDRDRFGFASMALNLKTNVPDFPRPLSTARASCVPKFGMRGAKVAVVFGGRDGMRQVMQTIVRNSPDLPQSDLGGPFALDAPTNSGSYLFNFGDMSEDKVDEWIACARSIGFNQIDFHGGASFRFGDFLPNPVTYPNGRASLKAVIDKLHAAGIKAGLHTYAFFIDKRTPYVTPVPDPRLAKSATFTLAAPLDAASNTVTVVESTEKISPITAFFERNSNTIQIGNELITFTGATKQPPYTFTGCSRGANGTTVAAHEAGQPVQQLKECFGLFVPDPETDMLAEIAANTAEIYNECGFDMIYLDALDGEDILGGWQNSWHYGSEFTFEIAKRLKKPALMEMSTFHHHLWYVRARSGAWDHPTRSHKKFIDLHDAGNEEGRRMFMPTHLGWWALKTWTGPSGDPTFSDDIEYLCCKAIGYDSSLSMMGINPDNYQTLGSMKELGPILKRYEDLRHSGKVSEETRAKLRVPGDEYSLVEVGDKQRLQPVQYAKHKVAGLDGWSDRWEVDNRFGEQPVQLRVQALSSAAAYDAPQAVPVLDLATDSLTETRTAEKVTIKVAPSIEQVKVGAASAKLTALSTRPDRTGSWAKLGKIYAPTLNLSATRALGVWVYGDGQGEVLNIQIDSPKHMYGMADHFVIVDFTGWRYCELIEPEGERHADYLWPYGNIYSIYREYVRHDAVEEVSVWVNNLPPGQEITCYLSPIRALPLAAGKITNPAVTIGGKTITFPVELGEGFYLEYRSPQDCRLFDPQGNEVSQLTPAGEAPVLAAGKGQASLTCTGQPGLSARANVWVISRGEPLEDEL